MKKRSQQARYAGFTSLRAALCALMALILCATMLTGMAPKAAAAGKASLTVRVPEKDWDEKEIDPTHLDQVKIQIFKIGEKKDGKWTLTGDFNVDGWQERLTGDPKAEEIMEAVKAFEKIIEEKPVPPTKGPQSLTVSGGVASTTFSDIDPGYYLVEKYVPADPNAEGEASKAFLMYPFLALLDTSVTVDVKAYVKDVPKTKVVVIKNWDDIDATMHHEGVSVKVHLLADGVETKEATLNAGNNWTAEWDDLYVYKAVITGAGKEAQYTDEVIEYSVVEELDGEWAKFYDEPKYAPPQASAKANETITFNITNPHKKGKLKIEKNVTVNGGTTTGKAADGTYKFNIKGVDVEYESKTPVEIVIKNGKSKTVTVGNLPCGTYKITEVTPTNGTQLVVDDQKEIVVSSDSTTEIETKSFTNNIDVTTVKITKKWVGGTEANRPASITVKLYADGKLKDSQLLNKKNSWTYTWQDLPKYRADGKTAIKYSLDEVEVKGFTSSGPITTTGPADQNFAITNTFVTTPPPTTRPPSNRTTPPPSNTTPPPSGNGGLRIYKSVTMDGQPTSSRQAQGTFTFEITGPGGFSTEEEITINAGARNHVDLTDLTPGTYTVTETDIPDGWTLVGSSSQTVTVTAGSTPTETSITFTNNLGDVTPPPETLPPTPTPPPREPTPTPPPTTEVNGQKIWHDDDNIHGLRPNEITVELLRDGVVVDSTPTWISRDDGTWRFTFGNLPVMDEEGHVYAYTVRELPVDGYTATVDGNTITNELIPRTPNEYINIAGVKVWDDGNNALGNRPNYITVRLLRDGVEIEQRTVTAANEWQYAFQNLPQDDGYGHTYTYTLREDTIPGYFTRINGYNITNVALPETIDENQTPLGAESEEGLEELLDLFDYGTPLFGELLQTGDETPMYPYIFGGIGVLAILILLVAGRRRRRGED